MRGLTIGEGGLNMFINRMINSDAVVLEKKKEGGSGAKVGGAHD